LAHQLAGPALDWAAHRKPAGREWCRLEAGPEATAYAIAWPPGTGVGFHDHGGAAGALAVVAGALTETMVRPVPGRPLWTCTRTIESGEHATFGARHVHRVHNSGTDLAVSVHVYAPALRTMTYFAPPGPSGLAALRTERL
jgi:predicted metal-dependent enzyme (double-stranded beta helix superfamily)